MISKRLYQGVFIFSWLFHFTFYFTFQSNFEWNNIRISQAPYVIAFHVFMLFWNSSPFIRIKSSYHYFGILLGLSYFIVFSYIIVLTIVIISGAFTIHKFFTEDNFKSKNKVEIDNNDETNNKVNKVSIKQKLKYKMSQYLEGENFDE